MCGERPGCSFGYAGAARGYAAGQLLCGSLNAINKAGVVVAMGDVDRASGMASSGPLARSSTSPAPDACAAEGGGEEGASPPG